VYATDKSLVGVWSDDVGTEIYTKLVIHDAHNVTYCYVQSCHQMECSKWVVEGSTDGAFSHQSELGKWQFVRTSQDSVDGRFTPAAGTTALVTYSPE